MAKSKRRICRGCGSNYEKSTGTKHFCSSECKIKNPRTKRLCEPACLETNVSYRKVKFITGDLHVQRYCTVCIRVTYVSDNQKQQEDNAEIRKASRRRAYKYGDSFYSSPKWLKLRYDVLLLYGGRCQLCSSANTELHVDHIKPRSKYPKLELDPNNLQVLCRDCNLGKSNKDETDFRNM